MTAKGRLPVADRLSYGGVIALGPVDSAPSPTLNDVQSPAGLTPPRRASGTRMPAARPAVPDEIVALHEAAHAAVGMAYGFIPKLVTIIPDPARHTSGSVHYKAPVSAPALRSPTPVEITPERWPQLENEIVGILAAAIATARVTAGSLTSQPGYAADYAQAAEIAELRGVHEGEAGRYLHWLSLRAEIAVELQWPNIVRIAEALLEERSLCRERILAIVQRVQTPEERERERIAEAMAAIEARIPEQPEQEEGDAADPTTAVV